MNIHSVMARSITVLLWLTVLAAGAKALAEEARARRAAVYFMVVWLEIRGIYSSGNITVSWLTLSTLAKDTPAFFQPQQHAIARHEQSTERYAMSAGYLRFNPEGLKFKIVMTINSWLVTHLDGQCQQMNRFPSEAVSKPRYGVYPLSSLYGT